MTKRFPLTTQQVQLLRGRYTAQLKQFFPIAYAHYEAVNSANVRSAFVSLPIYSDGIFNLLRTFLDEGRFVPDEQETQQLIVVLLAASLYFEMRGLGRDMLRWGLALYERCQQHGWEYEAALIPFLAKTHLEHSQPETARLFIETALASIDPTAHPHIAALLSVSLSSVFFKLRDYEQAIQFAFQATDILVKEDKPALYVDAMTQAFNGFMALGQREEALAAAETAYNYALKSGLEDPLRLVSSMVILGLAFTANQLYERAEPLYESGIAFYDSIGDEPNAARTRQMYAVHCFRAGFSDRARDLAMTCLLIYERYGLLDEAANAKTILSHLPSPATHPSEGHSQTSA